MSLESAKKQLEDAIAVLSARLIALDQELKPVALKQRCLDIVEMSGRPVTTNDILAVMYPADSQQMTVPIYRRKIVMVVSLVLHRLCKQNLLNSETIKGSKGKRYSIK